jgi:hypothetical protein
MWLRSSAALPLGDQALAVAGSLGAVYQRPHLNAVRLQIVEVGAGGRAQSRGHPVGGCLLAIGYARTRSVPVTCVVLVGIFTAVTASRLWPPT